MHGYCPRIYLTCSKERKAFQQSNPRNTVSLEEHSDNVQGQIYEHIFAPKGGCFVYYPSNIFHNMYGYENWGTCTVMGNSN